MLTVQYFRGQNQNNPEFSQSKSPCFKRLRPKWSQICTLSETHVKSVLPHTTVENMFCELVTDSSSVALNSLTLSNEAEALTNCSVWELSTGCGVDVVFIVACSAYSGVSSAPYSIMPGFPGCTFPTSQQLHGSRRCPVGA